MSLTNSAICHIPEDPGRAQKRVNSAAADLCRRDVKLLDNRGLLLELSRKKVPDEGYVFKKGHSRSKVYGDSRAENPHKRP